MWFRQITRVRCFRSPWLCTALESATGKSVFSVFLDESLRDPRWRLSSRVWIFLAIQENASFAANDLYTQFSPSRKCSRCARVHARAPVSDVSWFFGRPREKFPVNKYPNGLHSTHVNDTSLWPTNYFFFPPEQTFNSLMTYRVVARRGLILKKENMFLEKTSATQTLRLLISYVTSQLWSQ